MSLCIQSIKHVLQFVFRYTKGFLKSSEFGGRCTIDESFLAKKVQFDGELNAWYILHSFCVVNFM